MPASESTCWAVILAAAADREELARRYLGVVRAYSADRWRGSPPQNLSTVDPGRGRSR